MQLIAVLDAAGSYSEPGGRQAYLDIRALLQQQSVLRVEQEDAEGAVQRTGAVHPLMAAAFGGGAHLAVPFVHQQTHLLQEQLLLTVQGSRSAAERGGRPPHPA